MDINENNTGAEETKVNSEGAKRRGDILALILCLVVAFMLWGYVMSMESPTSERTFNGVKVSISNMENLNDKHNLSIVSESENLVVDVILQGKKSVLSKLTSDDIKAYIDVGNITEAGTHSLDIKYLPFPEGTTFAGSSSGSMSMKVDKKATIEVPIVVKYENCIIPDGYSVGEYILSVDTVRVEGAKADLDKIKEAIITISAGTLTNTLVAKDRIPMICDKNGKKFESEYISYDVTYVDVKLPVYLQKEIKLGYELVHDLYNGNNADISMSPSVLTVFGEASAVDKLPNEYIIAKIDEKNSPDSFKVGIASDLFGESIEIQSAASEVVITVSHKKTVTTQLMFGVDDIKVNNPHGLTYTLPKDGLIVTFRCSTDKLSYADNDNVMAVVDLSSVGAAEDSTEVIVTFNYSGDISGYMYELGQYTVEVGFTKSGD